MEDRMKRVRALSLSIAFLGLVAVGAPGGARAAARETAIPFDLVDHVILVKCRINDAPKLYDFVVDTGALTVIDKALADELQLKQRGPQAKIDTLRVGDCAVGRLFVFTNFDLQPLRDAYGVDVSGIIGSDLLEDYVATIDYAARRLTLSSDTTSLADRMKAGGTGYLLKFAKHPINHAPMVRCTLNDSIAVDAMLDTGQPYALAVPLKEFERTGASRQKSTITAKGVMIRWPGTSSPDNHFARLESLDADGLRVNGITAVFAELPSLLSVPLLGCDFLSQYRIVLDYRHGDALFVPREGSTGSDHSYSAGLSIKMNAESQLLVRGVWEGSPADRAGIRVGDRIVEFNARTVTPELQRDLVLLLNDGATESVELLLETPQGPRKVLLKKERLL
jgi:hypothetical protein